MSNIKRHYHEVLVSGPVPDLSPVLPGEMYDYIPAEDEHGAPVDDYTCAGCLRDINACTCELYDDFGIPLNKDEILDNDPDYQEWLDAREREAGMVNDAAFDFIKEGR